jgi:hypothetical protein
MGRTIILVAVLGVVAAPASAEMMKCTGENIGKMTTMSSDAPAKMAMNKEMAMANMEMSKGNMRGACMHFARAQRMKPTDAGMMGKM